MKKLLSLVLAAALLLTLAACGKPYVPVPNPPLVLGEKYLADLDYEQALLQFDQAIEIDPKNPRNYLGKVDALLHLDRQDEALNILEAGTKNVPKEQREDLQTVQADVKASAEDGFVGIARIYENLGWKEIALSLLRRAAAEFPTMQKVVDALNLLAGAIVDDATTIGSTIRFGNYDWIVLDIQEPYALILAKDVIEQRAYDGCEAFSSKNEWQLWFEGNASEEYKTGWEPHALSAHGAVTWESCTLRKYLNEEFYNQFTQAEKNRINLSELKNSDNIRLYGQALPPGHIHDDLQEWHTYGGNDTSDYIFLLSLAEAEEYLSLLAGASSWWWLRSPGDLQYKVAHVYPDGSLVHWGCIDDVIGSVRPAMYIRLV